MDDSRELAELTRELVAISSHEDESEAGDFIEEWLRAETDAEVTRDGAPRGGNVIARRGSDEPILALVGHHDVVAPADEQLADDGTPRVEERDGRIYGRGTADMKGAVAAMMLAFRDAEPAGELVFASFVGEETGGEGSQYAIEDGFAPDYAVVGEGSTSYSEPGLTDVVVTHRGRRESTIVAHGEAAHAGEPDAGSNAIYRACDAVEVLRSLDTPEVEIPEADTTLPGKVTATVIEGGETSNVVPDRCVVTVDERTVPDGRADLEAVEEIEGVEWQIEQDWPPMRCGDETFVEGVLSAARAVQSDAPEEPGPILKPHATDAGWLSAAGVECVVCGPSEPGEAHTDHESVSVDVLAQCEAIYRGVAEAPLG